ncbi:MAG: hypothetical protein K2X81_28795 [Candidatus Obscuribacterales bacterium]|nr:hypothetical protein [Candidatus Obscuribacterales bacterium]
MSSQIQKSNKYATASALIALTILANITFCSLGASADDQSILEAQKLFKQYTDFEHSYDLSQADLYAPNAIIKDTRIYQDGPSKTLTWNGGEYKQILKASLPVAKARNDQYNYSQVAYNKEGSNIRIKCIRYSVSKKYSAPLELVLTPNGKGGYKILEESCQSQP